MKRFSIILFSLFLLLTATAFIPIKQSQNTDPTIYKLMEVTYLWDLLKEGYEPIWDRDDTWLDVGFRSKYAMAKNYASLEMIEAAFGCPVFLRGPHVGEMDFNSKTSFGYYNQEFIFRLQSSIQAAFNNPIYKNVFKRVYQQHLESMAKTYHDAYIYLHADMENLQYLQNQYLYLMARPGGMDGGSFQENFRDFAESLERSQQADVYEAFTAPAFWLRRSIDGTSDQLFEIVDMVIKEMEKG
ncbi:MAG: hypothetical protein NXI23_06715 [Bacteroidetes bacterium]|jgi:hypothetical protein|nr:hypothetical protein [Bacteroidota bacterium]MDF1867549.1 hypothetical protein [Saprospiraceae bacterium]